MRKQQLIKLNTLLALLGIAVVCGVFFYTQMPEAGSDSRVTVDQGATASIRPQAETYAEEFPSTQNDYLGSAERFTLFGNEITVKNNFQGNVAAATVNDDQATAIQTEAQLHDQLVTGTGDDSNGRDVSYYQHASQRIPDTREDGTGLDPKVVLGTAMSGLRIGNDNAFYYNDTKFDQLKDGQLFQEPVDSKTPYIDIASTLKTLTKQSDAIANGQQTNLLDITPHDSNVTIFDVNNTGTSDGYGDNYENAYALKLTKKDSNGNLLSGAVFTIQYPLYPAHYKGSGTPAITGWADMYPGVELPITDDNQNPIYDADGNLETKKCNLYDTDHNLLPNDNQPLLVLGAGGKYALTTDANGEINVSVNVPSAYRFREIAAPQGYAMPTTLDTDVTTFRTSETPMARVFNIKWNEIFATGQEGKTGGNVYFLNMDLSAHAAPIQINIDFTGAPDDVEVGAPNVRFIAPEDSPADDISSLNKDTSKDNAILKNFVSHVTSAPQINIPDASVRATNYNKVLWNYKNATGKTVSVSSDTIYGTILAPATHLILSTGHVYGSLIADSVDVTGGDAYRWDLSYQPWTSSTDKITNNRTVLNDKSTLPETTGVTVKKNWEELKNSDHANTVVKVQLYQEAKEPDGTLIDKIATTDSEDTNPTSASLSSENKWSHTFKDLPTRDSIGHLITYYVKEVESPPGYTPVYVRGQSSDVNNLTLTNTQFGFDITKVASGSTTPLSGAEYQLTDLSADDSKTSKTITTTDQDKQPLTLVDPGTYLLKETKAPAGYQLDDKYYALKLVDHRSNASADSDYQWQEAVITAKDLDEAKSQAKSADLKWNSLPSQTTTGFTPDTSKTNVVHFKQADKFLPLKVTKVSEDGKTPLKDAEFSWQAGTEAPQSYTTGDDGQLPTTLAMTPNVLYQLTETKAPSGYQLSTQSIYLKDGHLVDESGNALTTVQLADSPATLKRTDDSNVLTFVDQPNTWQIKVVKQDADSGDQLDGATFKLAGDGDPQTLKPTAKAGDTSQGVPIGATYTLSETTSPSGYASLDGDITIKLAESTDPPTVKWQDQTVGTDDSQVVSAKVDADQRLITITVNDRKKGTLPSTGGTGILHPLEFSLALFFAAAVMFAVAWWQKRKAGEAA